MIIWVSPLYYSSYTYSLLHLIYQVQELVVVDSATSFLALRLRLSQLSVMSWLGDLILTLV